MRTPQVMTGIGRAVAQPQHAEILAILDWALAHPSEDAADDADTIEEAVAQLGAFRPAGPLAARCPLASARLAEGRTA